MTESKNTLYCGDNLVYLDPLFNSNRNYEVFWGETKKKRAFEDRHASTSAYIDYMRPRVAGDVHAAID